MSIVGSEFVPQDLLARGEELGFLSLEEVAEVLEEAGHGPEAVEAAMSELEEAGIELVDEQESRRRLAAQAPPALRTSPQMPMLGEMFPNRIRAVALSVAAAAQWMANFLVSTTFPPLAATGLGLAYGIYAFFAIVSLLFVWRVVRETKGRSLESMDAEYAST